MSFTYKHPHPAVTADCIVLSPRADGKGLRTLLVRRKNEPFKGHWAIPGGFMNIDEDAAAAARRELREETGLQVLQIMQLGAYTAVARDPRERVISIAYIAYVEQPAPVSGGDDAAQAQWFNVDELPDLAFDHNRMMADALELVGSANM